MKLSQLETDILDWFARSYPSIAIQEQILCCEVTEREDTTIGFFTSFKVNENVGQIVSPEGYTSFNLNELKLIAPELTDGADVILHIENGYLDCIEAYAITDGHPLTVSRYELKELDVNIINEL